MTSGLEKPTPGTCRIQKELGRGGYEGEGNKLGPLKKKTKNKKKQKQQQQKNKQKTVGSIKGCGMVLKTGYETAGYPGRWQLMSDRPNST